VSSPASDLIPAPGWGAVYLRDGKEFAWPLIAWLRPTNGTGPVLVGLTLSLDGSVVIRADEIEGFKCYLPPAEWVADPAGDPSAPKP
jgi:hypothetical protein